jgi:hypothetical protein
MAGHALVPAEPDARPYAEKSVLQRMASDLEPLTYMTAGTVRQSDRQVAALQAALARCDAGAWVIVAGGSVVDWRRVMVYAPTAVAVQDNDDGTFGFIARDGRFESIRDAEPVSSRCGLLWIGERPPRVQTSARAEHVADLGWRYNPGTGAATVRDLRWDASP